MEISFVLIARHKQHLNALISALKDLIKSQSLSAEIVIAIGENPSKQRNLAAQKASGEWLYFLDDDVELDLKSIEQFRLAKKFYQDAVVFGGPSLNKFDSANNWQKAIDLVFTSDFGIGPLKSRYTAIGPVRKTSERELILCNLIVKKSFFQNCGGFNENLYPNEENEFLARVNKVAEKIYSPLIIVYRQHRENQQSFFKQMLSYGIGRTRHFLYSENYSDYVYFIPLVLLVALTVTAATGMSLSLGLILVSFYFAVILPTCIVHFLFHKNIRLFFNSLAAFVVCHGGYSIGLLIGFFEKKKKRNEDVKIDLEKLS